MKKSRLGFSIVEVVLTLAALVLVGLVGYKVYKNQQTNDQVAQSTTTTPTKKATPSISQTTKDLDSQNVDTSLDPSQLDSAIDSLL